MRIARTKDRNSGREAVLLRNASMEYKGRKVWKGASFRINRGEFVAVIGPNGSGKTTMMRMLLGLQKPSSGSVTILGERPRRGNEKIGYVPQRHDVDNDTSIECGELVRLAYSGSRIGITLSPKRSAEERKAAERALREVDGSGLACRPLSSLSGGELQRVFLAEALVNDPEMLLLDEPLANVDVGRAGELVGLLDGISRSRKVTILLVAHDINPLIRFLDKIVYIANCRVATGSPEEVLTSRRLSRLYGTHVEVLHDSKGHVLIHTAYGMEKEPLRDEGHDARR